MKQGWLWFALVGAAMIFGGAWGITVMRPDLSREVWSSAVIAYAVQLLSFAIARPFVKTNPIAGWGLGSLLRLAVVVLHGLVGVPALGLVSGPALITLVSFLFVTMLIEPLFLRS